MAHYKQSNTTDNKVREQLQGRPERPKRHLAAASAGASGTLRHGARVNFSEKTRAQAALEKEKDIAQADPTRATPKPLPRKERATDPTLGDLPKALDRSVGKNYSKKGMYYSECHHASYAEPVRLHLDASHVKRDQQPEAASSPQATVKTNFYRMDANDGDLMSTQESSKAQPSQQGIRRSSCWPSS